MGLGRAAQAVRGADRLEVAERAKVAAQQQMIAIVDDPAEAAVEVGAAAAARLLGGFVERHRLAQLEQPDRRGEAREPRPDHVDQRHSGQSRPYRTASHRRSGLARRTGWSSRCQPRATSRSNVRR